MASVIGDSVTGHTYFPTMIATTTIQHQHSREACHYRSSRSRESPERRSSASPHYPRSWHTPSTRSVDYQPSPRDRHWDRDRKRDKDGEKERERERERHRERDRGGDAVRSREKSQTTDHDPSSENSSREGVSRFPSPPNSSSPSVNTTPAQVEARAQPQAQASTQNAPGICTTTQGQEAASRKAAHAAPPSPSSHQQPSPASDDFPMSDVDGGVDPYHTTGSFSPRQSPVGQVIEIRDLTHIQSLARADLLTGNGPGILNDPPLQQMKYDIHKMPINDIIEMVAALLSKITQTNDLQHDAIQRNVTHQQQANQNNESGNGSQMSPLSTSVLAFHGKNVPAITIHSYLSRIHRYCPTTYEVFLSLLVYFDRMTERVNEMVMKNEQAKMQQATMNPDPASASATQKPGEPR